MLQNIKMFSSSSGVKLLHLRGVLLRGGGEGRGTEKREGRERKFGPSTFQVLPPNMSLTITSCIQCNFSQQPQLAN